MGLFVLYSDWETLCPSAGGMHGLEGGDFFSLSPVIHVL